MKFASVLQGVKTAIRHCDSLSVPLVLDLETESKKYKEYKVA